MDKVRPAVSIDDAALEGAGVYFFFAERFGWTPDQVDDMPAWLRDRLATVGAVHDEVAEEKAKKAAR